MNWKDSYQKKLMPASQAAKLIKSGDSVVLSQAAAAPFLMIDTLADNKENYRDVKVFNVLNMRDNRLSHTDMAGHFSYSTIFATAVNRDDINSGHAGYIPTHFHNLPGLIGDQIGCDVAIIAMTRPDKDGYCSLSLSVDYALKAAKSAKILIAECNDRLPYTYGNSRIHVDEIHAVVESSIAPPESAEAKIGEDELAIGRHCASLINNGDTLQLGIGALPDAVLLSLKDKRNLGIHSEMFSDTVVDLIMEGIVTNTNKTLHPGKSVATFLMGSSKLYKFVNDNLDVEMHPVDYVNDPMLIMQLDNIVSINSALQIDLTGQICAETIGLRHYSGTGGQGDFIRGAAMAKNGKSIITILSTSKGGSISRIVPTLDTGAGVTTLRTDAHYIVTEYGVADLRGLTMQNRARALIKIAHPDFRDSLAQSFKERFNQEL